VPAQFHFYGWGQLVFSIGMFVAGAAGVPRKTMGAAAQGLDSPLKKAAMFVYGLGGAVAVLGGVLFIALVLVRLLGRPVAESPAGETPVPETPVAGKPGEAGTGLAMGVGAVLALLFLAMPAWRGLERATVESEAMAPDDFAAKVDAMIAGHRVGEDDGIPVVRPPPGDVYLVAERWRFTPLLELQAGRSYRVHVASRDTLHGVVLGGRETLLVPGRAAILPLTPAAPGRVTVVCSEYCGLEHNKMRNWITVLDGP
jgi:cytochrome c oxidase subunit 2